MEDTALGMRHSMNILVDKGIQMEVTKHENNDRKIIYIDVGRLEPEEAMRLVERARERLKRPLGPSNKGSSK